MLRNVFKINMPPAVRHLSKQRCERRCPQPQSPIRFGISLAFGKYLLLTNTLSSGTLMLIGDALQQKIEHHQKKYKTTLDYGRLIRMFIVGLGFGPLNHYFYNWLDKVLPQRNASAIRKKVVLDQVLMSPFCIVVFFYSMGLMEGKSTKQCSEEVRSKFLEVYMMDFFLCAPSQIINFYYVPVKYQVFYINAIALLYNMFLSYYKHRDDTSDET